MKFKKVFKLIILCFLFSSLLSAYLPAQEISRDKALSIARTTVDTQFPLNWQGNKANIDARKEQKTDRPYYILDVDNQGFVLVSKNSKCPPVLAYSYEGEFPTDLSEAPESFLAYLETIKKSCESYIKKR